MSEKLQTSEARAATADSRPLRLGIAGLGTVGCGVIDLLWRNGDLLERRTGRRLHVTAVSARTRRRERPVDIDAYAWRDNPLDLADPGDVDVVVELIGGSDGPALALARAALGRGLPLVTANKALIAHHGAELAALAEQTGAALKFEAAVAGGIPIVKTLREGLAANRIDSFHGILNGTANFILSLMEDTGARFADALAEAQAKGYAEADPTFDIDGIDAAHKTAILTSLAFGAAPDMEHLPVEGIRRITDVDIAFARELGYRVKLLGIARMTPDGLDQRVQACLIDADEMLAKVDGAFNAVEVHGDFVGPIAVTGLGAGAGPTASAVVADVVELARGTGGSTFSIPAVDHAPLPRIAPEQRIGAFYVRLTVDDRPGVMAAIASAMRDEDVSVERLIQRAREAEQAAQLIITTHETSEARMAAVLDRFRAIDAVRDDPCLLRIERF